MSLNPRTETLAEPPGADLEVEGLSHAATLEVSIQITIHVSSYEPLSWICKQKAPLNEPEKHEESPTSDWPIDNKSFGLMARARREVARLTRAELATRAGIADSTLRNVETNRHRATASVRRRLVSALEALGDAEVT